MKDRIEAAFNNLMAFSVCKEYQLYKQVKTMTNGTIPAPDSEEYAELLEENGKFNYQYAIVEHSDIGYAGAIALAWLKYSADSYLTYWTQNDAKVRPWHMELQGYTAHAEEFPSWMIPPIEYNCRCFLEAHSDYMGKSDLKNIQAKKKIKKPKELDDVYSESLAKCGKIFNDCHPYFTVDKKDEKMLRRFVNQLRNKYYGNG